MKTPSLYMFLISMLNIVDEQEFCNVSNNWVKDLNHSNILVEDVAWCLARVDHVCIYTGVLACGLCWTSLTNQELFQRWVLFLVLHTITASAVQLPLKFNVAWNLFCCCIVASTRMVVMLKRSVSWQMRRHRRLQCPKLGLFKAMFYIVKVRLF